jgi:hypothetical protein
MHNQRDKRSVNFGIGLGIVFAVAVVFAVYIIQRHHHFGQVSEPEVITITETLTDAQVVTRARSLGMAFPEEIPSEPTTPTEPDNSNAAHEPFEIPPELLAEALAIVEEQRQLAEEAIRTMRGAAEGFVWVQIRRDSPSNVIARQLLDAGVIVDQSAFTAFLSENRFETRLMAGTFLLPLNADFDAIMDHILVRSRRTQPSD